MASEAPAGDALVAIGGRYRVEGVLGEGGMAVVYQALDLSTGKRMALKQMRPPPKERRRAQMTELFEREFLTLAQLAHPRIVEAYDYGVDARGPYYTMELLDGGDLQRQAPLDWRKACALARDVCSALSLLHSRRLVYRDLSPRNIRCTSDGLAKLIDFGGMTAMGPNPEVIGTPPCAAPEALDCRPLDARTDLYALGATLYYTLVRRQAYPARTFDDLRKLWGTRPAPPSAFVAQLPEALDRLVMELMHFDPALRPVSAAEVMERLNAILGAPADEHLRVPQAYLSTPTLVGRDAQLAGVSERVVLAPEQRGGSVLVHGAEGAGRSRFLEACALEAKLAGMIVLRADAAGVEHAPYAVVRSLVAQLLDAARELAFARAEPYLAELAPLLPELARISLTTLAPQADIAEQEHTQLALLQWLGAVAQERPVLVAVDDVARLDDASAAFVGLLAREAPSHALGVVVTASSAEARGRQRHTLPSSLSCISTLVDLVPLDPMQTKELLGSVFGEVPNLHTLASYVFQVAAGNPRDSLRVVQHLVNEKLIRYECGSWSLPERLPTDRLPASMAEARKARLDALSPDARRVVYAFACEPRQRFSFDDCLLLGDAADPSGTLQILRQLLESGFVVRVGARYRLAQLGFLELLESALPATEQIAAHRCLARIFERHDDGIRLARHLFRCGEEEHGLQALVADAERSQSRTNASSDALFAVLKTLPKDWLSVYDQALALCDKHARAHRDRDVLLARLNGILLHVERDTDGFEYLKQRLSRLEREAGLDLYAALPEALGQAARLRGALEQATARHRQTPAHERVLAPQAAVKPLASTLLAALGVISTSNDYVAFRRLPSLAPLAPLSPTIMVVDQLARGLGARITGRSERAIAIYDGMLTRMSQEDRAGLTASEHLVCRLRVLLSIGALEAAMGLGCALERLAAIQGEHDYETQALMLRHLCQLWQGQGEEAARTKRRLEIRKALGTHHGFDGQYLLSELCAYAVADDLTHVKQVIDTAATHAAIHPAWVAVLHYGRGEYHRIRCDGERALAELREALALMRDGYHQIWAHAAGALLRTLVHMRRHEEAIRLGEAYTNLARVRGLGYTRSYIYMPLSLALAGAGERQRALALADEVVEGFRELGSTGLNLALAYETRARVAGSAGDDAGFEHYAALSAEQWPAGGKRLVGIAQAQRGRKRAELNPQQSAAADSSQLRNGSGPGAVPTSSRCLTVPRVPEGSASRRGESSRQGVPNSTPVSTQDDRP